MLFYGVCFGCHGRDDLSLLVKLDGLFELVETGSIAVHVHEGLVALPEGGILAFHGLNLGHAACLNHVKVGLDTVAYDQNGPNGLDPPAKGHSSLGSKVRDDVRVDTGGGGKGLSRDLDHCERRKRKSNRVYGWMFVLGLGKGKVGDRWIR